MALSRTFAPVACIDCLENTDHKRWENSLQEAYERHQRELRQKEGTMPKGVPSPETMAARAAARAEKAALAAAQAQQNLAAARGEAVPVEGVAQPSIPPEGEQLAPPALPTAESVENVFAPTSKSKWFLAQVGLYEGKPYITFPDDLEMSTQAYVEAWWLETKIRKAGGAPLPAEA